MSCTPLLRFCQASGILYSVRSLLNQPSTSSECAGLPCRASLTAWSTSCCSDLTISSSSTLARTYIAATANSTLRHSPNKAKETIRRVRSLRRERIGVDHAITDTVAGMDQRLVEGLVDGGAQAVDVHAQGVGVGQLLAPHLLLQILARDHRRTGV